MFLSAWLFKSPFLKYALRTLHYLYEAKDILGNSALLSISHLKLSMADATETRIHSDSFSYGRVLSNLGTFGPGYF